MTRFDFDVISDTPVPPVLRPPVSRRDEIAPAKAPAAGVPRLAQDMRAHPDEIPRSDAA